MGDADGKGYVLTAIPHRAPDAPAPGEPVTFTFTVSVDPSAAGTVDTPGALLFSFQAEPVAPESGVQKGAWIADVSYEVMERPGGSTVAMETLTIAHEGFLLI